MLAMQKIYGEGSKGYRMKQKNKIKTWKQPVKKCFTCGSPLGWTGHPFMKFYHCPKGCKKILRDILRYAERVRNIDDANKFLKLNKIQDYEMVILWSEEE